MNQSTIHATDCGCSKCPGTRLQRHRRFFLILCVCAFLVAMGGVALIAMTVPS